MADERAGEGADERVGERADERPDARARAGLGHLQVAVLELIEAARAFLDVAESVVRDPELLARLAQRGQRPAPPGQGPGGPDDGVEHIWVR